MYQVLLLFLFFCLSINLSAQKTNDYLIVFSDSSSFGILYGFKTPAGKIVIPAKYYDTLTDTLFNVAIVRKAGWYGINKEDSAVFKVYDPEHGVDVYQKSWFEDGMIRFKENNKIGFADENGIKSIPAQFDFAYNFTEGLAAFNLGGYEEYLGSERFYWRDGLWGFVNKNNEIVIKPQFTRAAPFENGMATVTLKSGKKAVINKNGEIVTYR